MDGTGPQQERGVRIIQVADHGVVICSFRARQSRHLGILVLGILIQIQGKYRILCRNRRAVVEGGVLPQMEGVGLSILTHLV